MTLMTRSAGVTRKWEADPTGTVGWLMSVGVKAVFVSWMRLLGKELLALVSSHQYSSKLSIE